MNPMIENLSSLSQLIREKVPELDKQIRHSFSHHDLLNIKQIVLTGCGDSYFASTLAKYSFKRFSNVNTLALPSMEAGRYYIKDVSSPYVNNPFVMATSVSGEVSRTIEALAIANDKGCYTVAVTGNLTSSLAKNADKLIEISLPSSEHNSPGITSYRMSSLALILFSIHLAEVHGRILMSEADKLRRELINLSDYIEKTIVKSEPIAKQMVSELSDHKYFEFVSDGPGMATAEFSAAKIIEATGCVGLAQDTEEWAHLQYFEDFQRAIPTFLISSGQRGFDRLNEIARVMKRIGRKVILISTEEEMKKFSEFDYFLPVVGDCHDEFRPIHNPIGCELFAAYLSEKLDKSYFRRGTLGYEEGNGIRDSLIVNCKDLK